MSEPLQGQQTAPVPEDVGVKLRLSELIADFRAHLQSSHHEHECMERGAADALAAYRGENDQWRSGYTTELAHIHETFKYLHGLFQEELKQKERLIAEFRQESKDALREAFSVHYREHERQREASTLAGEKLDKRLEDSNHSRDIYERAQSTFINRDQLDDKINAIFSKMEAATNGNATLIGRVEDTTMTRQQTTEKQVTDLQNWQANMQGRSTSIMTTWGVGSTIVAIIVGVALHFIK